MIFWIFLYFLHFLHFSQKQGIGLVEFFDWASRARSPHFDRARRENHEPGKNCFANFSDYISLYLYYRLLIRWCIDMIIMNISLVVWFNVWNAQKMNQNVKIFLKVLLRQLERFKSIPMRLSLPGSELAKYESLRAKERASGSRARSKIRPA